MVGECGKCRMKVKVRKCEKHKVAKVYVIKQKDGKIVELVFFDEHL